MGQEVQVPGEHRHRKDLWGRKGENMDREVEKKRGKKGEVEFKRRLERELKEN